MIEVQNLSKSYINKGRSREILNNISFLLIRENL